MKPSIFIAMPNLGTLRVGHTDNLLRWFMSGKYRLKWYPVTNVFPHDRARNLCHKVFMNTGVDEVQSELSKHFEGGIDFERYDYMLFLDADTVPPASVIDQLIEADKDMISATVQTWKTEGGKAILIPVALRMSDEGYKVHWGSGIEEVDATTCACTLIKREVLEKVGPRAFQFMADDAWGTDGIGEDFYFCERVKAAGFSVWNHYGIICSHHKEVDTLAVNALLAGDR